MVDNTTQTNGVRIAVEGCVCLRRCSRVQGYRTNTLQGHGTLNAIYAAVDESCKIRGWDGVDLVVIGGDFQVSLV